MEQVILVDTADNPIGLMEKMEAHQKGLLHRAFSVFIFNDDKQLLMQRRAFNKYHSGGLWTNSCCSHPKADESLVEAGQRRLVEEMGFETALETTFSFIYRAELDNDLIEHEFDHILVGNYSESPMPNPTEVCDWQFMDLDFLEQEIDQNPQNYTVWFLEIFNRVKNQFLQEN